MRRAVVFDLDGTLVDTPSGIVRAFTAVFAEIGAPQPGDAAIRATIGRPLSEAFGGLLGSPTDDALVAECVQRYLVLFREIVLPVAPTLVFPGVVDGLGVLRDAGFLLSVATSKFSASAEALLEAAGLRSWFDLVVGADQVSKPKPDPEMGFAVLKALGVAAADAVVVGDTTHDLLMARASGMDSIAVTYGVHDVDRLRSAEPTWIAEDFGDVVAHASRTTEKSEA
ncbi:HAD family hydrolase [Umezawaea sp. Da 62-37]|uniref:HAD family hydrolase n=1 Tax=Umezawaea sp. Da 62-37 TaxID=3075927 RepID=UPI0028F6FF65|nr:HAD family hydrolase [Umezawaea sp. Da 62-37]WNV87874.1 HAD family hydrolase [Umezawaea sp. Da 62-37]